MVTRRFLLTLCCLLVGFVAATPDEGAAAEKWLVMGSTVWSAEGSSLDLDFPLSAPNDLRVKADAAGSYWIMTSPQISFGSRIKQVILCYQTPDAGTYINQIRLSEYILTIAPVLRDLSPIPESSAGTCYSSPPLSIQPAGALYVGARLIFANASDSIAIGALGLLIEE